MAHFVEQGHTLLSRIATITFVVGLFLSIIGIILVYLGATGNTEFNFFGQSFKSSNVGIAAIFLGSAMIVLNIRRTLTSFDRTVQAVSNLKNGIKAQGDLQVSDIQLSYDKVAQACLVDFRVSNTGGSDISINGIRFQVLAVEEWYRLGYKGFSKIYGLDISELKQKGDKIETAVSQVIHPGEADRFGVKLVAKEMPNEVGRKWKLQPILLSNIGNIATKPIEIWLEN